MNDTMGDSSIHGWHRVFSSMAPRLGNSLPQVILTLSWLGKDPQAWLAFGRGEGAAVAVGNGQAWCISSHGFVAASLVHGFIF